MGIFGRLLGVEDPIKASKSIVVKINELEAQFERFSHEELVAKTRKWQVEVRDLTPTLSDIGEGGEERTRQAGEVEEYLNAILPEAFAAVREAAKRTLGQRHYDVQLVGGIMLHQGKVAEMKTGEGKTLAATLPVYLNALAGRGVHVVTVNDYLARRDASWMGQIYDYLGLTISAIQHEASYLYAEKSIAEDQVTIEGGMGVQIDVKNLTPCSRQQAYAADILYGTNNEYGFDYLRDNMAPSLESMAQRDLHFAIVDEVDSILVDEARTPLIISAPDVESTDLYREFAGFATGLEPEDYLLEEKHKQVTYTEKGYEKLEKKYGQAIYSDIKLRHHADAALRAQVIFKKDGDYVVKDGEIIVVDEFTGRLMFGRRYSEGLHQAIEAKEGVVVKQESKTLATITFQNYFRLYHKLSGMTGTASTEAEEFHKIYKLDVVEIPTNNPMIRADLPDSVYKTEQGKFEAIAREVKRRHETGQPILIGTISIERNEFLSSLLKTAGVKHEILNAKNHEHEAHIIAQAGHLGAVTLATNIAGRGVDIILGGNPPDAAEANKVKEAGGLHVLGTERHESRRIDNQLRGRSGRQGDPGTSQFFMSLEDDLMRIFGGDRVKRVMDALKIPDDQPIEHGLVSKTIENAQTKIEGLNFDMRKHVLEYDDVLNKQRTVIYTRRKKILKGETDLSKYILEKVKDELQNIVMGNLTPARLASESVAGRPSLSDIGEGGRRPGEVIYHATEAILPISDEQKKEFSDPELWTNHLTNTAQKLYEDKQQKLTAPVWRQIEKIITLQTIDNYWMEHLDTMDHLRQSVRLRGYAQKDPLIEYKQDGLRLFQEMLAGIDRSIVYTIFKVEVRPREENLPPQEMGRVGEKSDHKIGRNDPCPCGSGKKYKRCHGK